MTSRTSLTVLLWRYLGAAELAAVRLLALRRQEALPHLLAGRVVGGRHRVEVRAVPAVIAALHEDAGPVRAAAAVRRRLVAVAHLAGSQVYV